MTRAWFLSACLVAAIAGCNKKDDQPAKTELAATPPATPIEAPKTAEPLQQKAREPRRPDAKLLERGTYLVKATGCAVCHTAIGPNGPDLEHAFAGGLEMPDKFGTWRTPNITPDKNTGIGNWTDDQIAAAIREGVRPDGSGIYAIMPFMNYAAMSDDDVKAIVAFLRQVKPVQNVVAPNRELKMPKGPPPNLVELQAARASGDATSDDPLKRGSYLASLMLCSHCHWTPGKDFTPQPGKMFSGGLPIQVPMLGTGTLVGKNITSDLETGIGKWTEDQIYAAIKTMMKPDGKQIQGPMLFLQSQWSQLDDKDLHAVAAFIKQLPPVKNKVAESTFKPNPPPAAKH